MDEENEPKKGKPGVRRRSLEQKIADEEAKLARLKQQRRARENSEKIITGAVVIETAMQSRETRDWLLDQLNSQTSDRDKERLAALIERLKNAEFKSEQGGNPKPNGEEE